MSEQLGVLVKQDWQAVHVEAMSLIDRLVNEYKSAGDKTRNIYVQHFVNIINLLDEEVSLYRELEEGIMHESLTPESFENWRKRIAEFRARTQARIEVVAEP